LVERWLNEQPDVNAKDLFFRLQDSTPEPFPPGQLRTLQRRVKQWRSNSARQLVLGVDQGLREKRRTPRLQMAHHNGVNSLPMNNREHATSARTAANPNNERSGWSRRHLLRGRLTEARDAHRETRAGGGASSADAGYVRKLGSASVRHH
jgi:hypothetical protein